MSISHEQIGVWPPPTSSTQLDRSHAVTTDLLQVPDWVIEAVVVNPFAGSALHPRLRYLATADYLKSIAVVSAPFGYAQATARRNSASWCRTVPCAYGVIPFLDFVGGVIKGKGASLNGRAYWQESYSADGFDPWGFFGDADAHFETTTSNNLLAAGFRSHLVLGTIVYKPVAFRRWLLNLWRSPSNSAQSWILSRLEQALTTVSANGHQPVFQASVTGTLERLDALSESYTDNPLRNPRLRHHRQAELARGARLLLCEATQNPNWWGFTRYTGEKNHVLNVLSKLANRQKLSYPEALIYLQTIISLITHNASALGRFYENPQIRNSPHIFDAYDLATNKDIDLAFFQQDYEIIRQSRYGQRDLPTQSRQNSYASAMIQGLQYFIRGEFVHYALTLDASQKLRTALDDSGSLGNFLFTLNRPPNLLQK